MNKATRACLEYEAKALRENIEQNRARQAEAQADADRWALRAGESEATLAEIEADLKAA